MKAVFQWCLVFQWCSVLSKTIGSQTEQNSHHFFGFPIVWFEGPDHCFSHCYDGPFQNQTVKNRSFLPCWFLQKKRILNATFVFFKNFSLLRRRASSPAQQTPFKSSDKDFSNRSNVATSDESAVKRRQKLSKKLGGWKEVLADEIGHSGVASNLLELLRSLMPAIEVQAEKQSSLGRLSRLQDALKLLHVAEKSTELTDQLMLPTLGSQEGAFENVRMSYSGDQGQSIRQLVTGHMIRSAKLKTKIVRVELKLRYVNRHKITKHV